MMKTSIVLLALLGVSNAFYFGAGGGGGGCGCAPLVSPPCGGGCGYKFKTFVL